MIRCLPLSPSGLPFRPVPFFCQFPSKLQFVLKSKMCPVLLSPLHLQYFTIKLLLIFAETLLASFFMSPFSLVNALSPSFSIYI